MISIIICSTNPQSLDTLKKNIHETIGTDYELVIIDNSANNHSIFSAYNIGIERSRYPYLCFVHEDVLFHSLDWGKWVYTHLQDPVCGFIGVCGGFILPRVPSSWSFYDFTEHILQSDRKHTAPVNKSKNVLDSKCFKQVVTLDGVFLSARKNLFEKVRFDDKNFNGFHFYDVDICLQAHFQGYENRAIQNILMEHFSGGNQNRQWIENSMIYWKKWGEKMPVSVIEKSEKQLQEKEYRYMTGIYMKRMIRAGYSTQEILQTMKTFLKHIYGKNERRFQQEMRCKILLTRLTKKPSTLIPAFLKRSFSD